MRPARAATRREQVGARVAPVRARVAEHDHASRAGAGRPRPARGTRATRGRSRCSRRRRRRRRRARSPRDTALKLRSRAKTSVTSEIRSTNTKERMLAERVVQRVQDREEEHRRAGDARGHVAEHVELRPPRAAAAGTAASTGTPPVWSEARIVRRTSTCGVRAPPARLVPLRREPALELRDDAVHGGEVLQRPGRQRAVELVERPRGRKRLVALDLGALELAPQLLLEAPDLVARERLARRPPAAARPCAGPSARRIRCTSTPSTPEPSPRRPKRRDREPREVAHGALVAVADRLQRLLAQGVEVDLLAAGLPSRSPCSRTSRATPLPPRRGRSSARRRARTRAGPRATWPASRRAPRGRRTRSVQGTCSSAAKASSSSDVPDRHAPRAQRLGEADDPGRRGSRRARGQAQPHADALGHDVEVRAVLDDDAHRRAEHLLVDARRRRAAAAPAPSRSTRRSTAAS